MTVVKGKHRQAQEEIAADHAYSRSHRRPYCKHISTGSAVPKNIVDPFPIPYEPE